MNQNVSQPEFLWGLAMIVSIFCYDKQLPSKYPVYESIFCHLHRRVDNLNGIGQKFRKILFDECTYCHIAIDFPRIEIRPGKLGRKKDKKVTEFPFLIQPHFS